MARVIVTALAGQDTANILADIVREAGYPVVEKYNTRFEALYDRLVDHPKSCQARPRLRASIRVGVIAPYLVVYRYTPSDDTVGIVRVLHGSRHLTRKLLRGE